MKNQRITVRLNEKTAAILAQEHARGISTTELVNHALIGIETNPIMERLRARGAMAPLSRLETLLEHANEPLKTQLRKELQELCRTLSR
ncbi:MAG: hypothetical protein IJ489_00250 [Clostridia bacterium]|nr:hypothetical protein [Clostridia bacterium]